MGVRLDSGHKAFPCASRPKANRDGLQRGQELGLGSRGSQVTGFPGQRTGDRVWLRVRPGMEHQLYYP